LFDRRKFKVIPELKDEVFLSNQIDLRFYPDVFKLEFKQVNEQIDRVGDEKNVSLIINRRTIALTPLMMKQFVNLVNKVLLNYEKKYGEIKLPKMPKIKKEKEEVKSGAYIG